MGRLHTEFGVDFKISSRIAVREQTFFFSKTVTYITQNKYGASFPYVQATYQEKSWSHDPFRSYA